MPKRRLRILLLSPLPPPIGGIASWTERYFEWARNNGLDVDIVNTAVIGQRTKQISGGMKLTDEIRRTRGIIKTLMSKMDQFRPDVVHLNTSCSRFGVIRDYACAALVDRKKVPLVVHYRCNIEDRVDGNTLQGLFFRSLARKATLNLVLNVASKEYVISRIQRDPRIVANFVDEAYVLDRPKSVNPAIKNVAFVGAVTELKGAREIIEVAKDFPEIAFTLAGQISTEIRDSDAPSNVTMLGPIGRVQVRDLLSKSDVFLFPTHTEGFANALLEAMAMGLPIITTPVGANADMIEDSGGIMVQVKDTKGITDAIIKLESQEYRRKISSWNVSKVKNNYVVDSVMKTLIGMYDSLVKGSS